MCLAVFALAVVVVGCGENSSDSSGFEDGGGATGNPATDPSGNSSSGLGSSSSSDDSGSSSIGTTDDSGAQTSETPRYDVPIPDLGNESPSGCSKVDVILAADNSSTMRQEIDALRGPVFDSLVTTLLDVHEGIDEFHLGVIDACPKPAAFHDANEDGACSYASGSSFVTSADPNLAESFACATSFDGTGNGLHADACLDDLEFEDDDEQPALTAAQAALDPMGMNAGFLRDDALLFVVAITDEDEALVDVGDTDAIYQSLIDAKGGDPTRVVFLGIGGQQACSGLYGDATSAPELQALAAKFEFSGTGIFWDICQGSLEEAFETAITDVVDPACETFVPAG